MPGCFHYFSQYCLNSLDFPLILFKVFFLFFGRWFDLLKNWNQIIMACSISVEFSHEYITMLLPFCCPQKSKCISFRHWHQLSKGQKIPFISFWAVKVVNCKCCAIAYAVISYAMKKEDILLKKLNIYFNMTWYSQLQEVKFLSSMIANLTTILLHCTPEHDMVHFRSHFSCNW